MMAVRKWTILGHRYLGTVLGALMLMWFVSGIAMIYAREMPRLTPALRLARLPALNFDRVRLSPADAARMADVPDPSRIVLSTIMQRPAYRISGAIVFADTGQPVPEIGADDAVSIAAHFMNVPEARCHHAGVLTDADQWTLEARRQLPMHKVVVDDEAGTELYLSEQSGDVVVLTTRKSRALAWVAAIPHWLYFTSLRRNDRLWREVVLSASGIGIVLAVLGLALALVQYRVRYRGLMRWHYVTGVVFGAFTLTWVFSGFLSMQPWDWSSGGGLGSGLAEQLSGGPLDLSRYRPFRSSVWSSLVPGGAREIEFLNIQGRPYYSVLSVDVTPILIEADRLAIRREPFAIETLIARARSGNPGVPLVASRLLTEPDAYYYARDPRPPLPVLRLQFGDPDATWFYVDPRMGRSVARFTRRERVERWIYHGLHSLDFPFWYERRPLWDIVVLALLAGGATSSGVGLFVGLRRLVRRR